MGILNLRKVDVYEVESWLYENIPELTKYQKECIRDNEIVRFAPFNFYKHDIVKSSFLWRLTILPLTLVISVLYCSLPFKYLFTGIWGYRKLDWYRMWTRKIGL